MASEGNDLLNGLVAGYLAKVSPGISKKFKVCQLFTLPLFVDIISPPEPPLLPLSGNESGRGGGPFLQDGAAQAEAGAGDQRRARYQEDEEEGGGERDL